jgi:hypothetical protein
MADIISEFQQPGPASPRRVALASYIVFEVFLRGSEQFPIWVEIGREKVSSSTQEPQPISLRGVIPPNGDNTSYYLRARSGNDSIGEGDNLEETESFPAYMEGGL